MHKMPEPIARDDSVWQGHPDVVYHNEWVYIVWRESDRHLSSGPTRIKLKIGKITNLDTLRYVSEHTIAESTHRLNCPRISVVDGSLYIVCDEIESGSNFISAENDSSKTHVITWKWNIERRCVEDQEHTNIRGIVPDRLVKCNGHYLIATHTKKHGSGEKGSADSFQTAYDKEQKDGRLVSDLWVRGSDNKWENTTLADVSGLHLCEPSLLINDQQVCCLLRENSGRGLSAYFAYSWGGIFSKPVPTRLFGCHRPVWNFLSSGNILVTYREQSSIMSPLCWARNTFAALIPVCGRNLCDVITDEAIILPLDHDRSSKPDGGYTGWTELPDGRIFVVNYITNDAPKPYIQGYLLREEDFVDSVTFKGD